MSTKRSVLIAAAAIMAVAGAGGAIAATKLTSPKQESQAVIDDAAAQLGVEPAKLSAALRKAMESRIDRAVADGRLTKAEGDALKERIRSSQFPLFGGPGRHHGFGPGFGPGRDFRHRGGPFGGLDGAAAYLGLTRGQLHESLAAGKSLADVARTKGKSVDGLIGAMTAAAEKKLDAAVEAGRLTKTQKQEMLAGLKQRITDLVNGRFRERLERRHEFRGGPGERPGFRRPSLFS